MSDNIPTYISPFKVSDDLGELAKFPNRLIIGDSLNNDNISERPFLFFKSQIHTDIPGSNNVTSYPDEIKRIAGESVGDASGKTLYYSETNIGLNATKTNDFLYRSFVVQRWFPGESTAVQNGLYFRIYDDKTRAIVVSPGTESAWRTALGANSSGVWTASMIPNLDASKITTGTFAPNKIAAVNNSAKLNPGVLPLAYGHASFTTTSNYKVTTDISFGTNRFTSEPRLITQLLVTRAVADSENNAKWMAGLTCYVSAWKKDTNSRYTGATLTLLNHDASAGQTYDYLWLAFGQSVYIS